MHLRATDDPGWQFDRLTKRRMEASAYVPTIAALVSKAAFVLRWGARGMYPPASHRDVQAAELAIRWSCDEYRHVAKVCAEDHGLRLFDQLEQRLRSCDTTPDRRAELIKQFVREVLDVREWHLLHDAGRAPCETREFNRLENSEEGEEQ